MSIIAAEAVTFRRFSGYLDSRFPIATWEAAGLVTGDLTGGSRQLDLRFSLVPQAPSYNMFSLEAVTIVDSELTPKNVLVFTQNMGQLSVLQLRVVIPLLAPNTGGGLGPAPRDTAALKGIFLGSRLVTEASLTSTISITAANADTFTLSMRCEGYVWGPRSVLADGGPARPLQGLYL